MSPLPRISRPIPPGLLAAWSALCLAGVAARGGEAAPQVVLELPPSEANPRNSEGDFILLKDGRLLFIYTHFTGGGADNASAHLAGRISADAGLTWSREDSLILPNEGGENVMSVSLLRLRDGRIALCYLRKNSWEDCRPWIRFSQDEARTWSEPVAVVPDSRIGYYVVNNDRLVQLDDGRLILPSARHTHSPDPRFSPQATLVCHLSDDGGKTWRPSVESIDGNPPPGRAGSRITLQEPGVVPLKDGSVWLYARTGSGSQYVATSGDRGDTWTEIGPSELQSPMSPASISRIPQTGELMAVWNDHRGVSPDRKGKRTPLSVALSTDEGATWQASRTLFDLPSGWYCYTAIEWVPGEAVILAHCAGDRSREEGLSRLRLTRVPLSWIRGPGAAQPTK